jgi:periplasmic divalent cation tolerance protein
MTIEQVLLVVTNVSDMACAELIARYLLQNKLAACVNCLPGVKSLYRWQGAIEEASEASLSIKTSAHRYPELQAAITSLHPYQIQEIIAFPVADGWQPYLGWIPEETKKDMHV